MIFSPKTCHLFYTGIFFRALKTTEQNRPLRSFPECGTMECGEEHYCLSCGHYSMNMY